MDFIDFYDRAMPTPVAKAAPTPWDGKEGDDARARGVRTADEFAVFKIIEDECRSSKSIGAHITDDEIARRLHASPVGVGKIVQGLLLRGVIRAQTGMLGVRSLVPSVAK